MSHEAGMLNALKRALRRRPLSPDERLKRTLAQLEEAWSLDAFLELKGLADEGIADAQYELGRRFEKALGIVQNLDDALEWYERAAVQQHRSAQARAGLLLMSGPPAGSDSQRLQQDFSRAAQWNKMAAEAGDSGAQLRYGLQLAQGVGVERDLEAARTWLQQSATQDDIAGLTALGVLRAGIYGGDDVNEGEALQLLERAAKSGDSDAQYWLGIVRGRVNAKYETEAFQASNQSPQIQIAKQGAVQSLEEAALQGHVQAMYQLGLAYWSGGEVSVDLGLAETWLRRAASRDHWESMRGLAQMLLQQSGNDGVDASSLLWRAAEKGDQKSAALLAELFLQGRGVPRDPIEAARWLVAAGAHARPQAMTALADLQAHGLNEQAGHEAAYLWLERASEAGDLAATFTLGSLYHQGLGVPRDDSRAILLYQNAANSGSSAAAFYLGILCADIASSKRDDAQALRWFQLASKRGYAVAVCNLATMIHQGRGVAPNPAAAARVLGSATARGNPRAATMLARWSSDGWHLARNIERALVLLRPVVACGDVEATALLAHLHLHHGVEIDSERIKKVLSNVCEGEHPVARNESKIDAEVILVFAQLLEASEAKNTSRIIDAYERAAFCGSATAQAWIALRDLRHIGLKAAPETRIEVARRLVPAARQGHVEALLALDSLIDSNESMIEVLTPAEKLQGWIAASVSGHTVAQRELGKCYLSGSGCPADAAMAASWLRRAARQDDAEAIELMTNLLTLDERKPLSEVSGLAIKNNKTLGSAN